MTYSVHVSPLRDVEVLIPDDGAPYMIVRGRPKSDIQKRVAMVGGFEEKINGLVLAINEVSARCRSL